MRDKNYWLEWFKAAGIRALKTFAQACVGLIPAAATIADVNWLVVLGTAALSGVVSMLTSLAGLPEVEDPNKKKTNKEEK